LAKSIIISFQYNFETVYFFYSNPIFTFLQLNLGKREVINNCLNFGRMLTKIIINWPNRKFFFKKTNRTCFKVTNIIAKRYRKYKKKINVL
jgi:hypothetical protein